MEVANRQHCNAQTHLLQSIQENAALNVSQRYFFSSLFLVFHGRLALTSFANICGCSITPSTGPSSTTATSMYSSSTTTTTTTSSSATASSTSILSTTTSSNNPSPTPITGCPDHDGTIYVGANGGKYQRFCNTDFWGNDLTADPGLRINFINIETCMDLCDAWNSKA